MSRFILSDTFFEDRGVNVGGLLSSKMASQNAATQLGMAEAAKTMQEANAIRLGIPGDIRKSSADTALARATANALIGGPPPMTPVPTSQPEKPRDRRSVANFLGRPFGLDEGAFGMGLNSWLQSGR